MTVTIQRLVKSWIKFCQKDEYKALMLWLVNALAEIYYPSRQIRSWPGLARHLTGVLL